MNFLQFAITHLFGVLTPGPGFILVFENAAIYGSGRILDALIKYGGLTLNETVVADKFLWQHAGDLGINILNPTEIDWKTFSEVYVLARSSEHSITSWLKSQGARQVTTLQEIWNR